ncbi:predicted endonuclease-methyltransferase fusion protein [Desulfurococcus amylolyticus 1221n]|uniref:site-specific DNA-methyltransferase (adenine-specific) n=1 Tax=Desulfurococcus amylolyticus (strain DSM 18924 / JCM 16383 / VKM B-2413 / 1221n) TaxID=490899 RepID=B8D5Z8_DESA1|nr:N-6 DNA methylase [Desulfurococcus amylolyticus]ACL11529.1 predicted endonuclease-methyltransferase fusion protein [Desulfurococcus amylolyticus 1221n]
MSASGTTRVPSLDIDDIVNCFKVHTKKARNEEELRLWVSSYCIEEKILKPLGVLQYGKYEYTLVSGARVDALYGHVIIEYKAPGRLSSEADIARAKEQVIKYIQQEASSEAEWDRYLGVIISDKIAFVRYDKAGRVWILRGSYEITRESVIKLIEAIRGLRRKALRVDLLLDDFGLKSNLTARSVRVLYEKLLKPKSEKTKVLFEDWLRLFKQATGYSAERLEELPRLAREYGLTGEVDYDKLLFAVQTYYALILKLLAAEVVYLYGGGRFYKSYIAELDDAYTGGGVQALRKALAKLESGGIFKQFGIENFLEGDYFSWYLEELDQILADVLAEIARKLANYEPATPQLEPESARDLLKRLYQHLVPEDVRHNLGEYYTPDWLADFLLDRVGLSRDRLNELGSEYSLRPLEIRVLDPACGSGTFLVRYIARLRDYAREHFLEDVMLDYLLENIVGYDLNPLAVLAARTNYLLMIADLPRRGSIEIPVYLADSIMVEKRATLTANVYVLKTVAGEFQLPVSVVEKGLLPRVLGEIVGGLNSNYSVKDFKNRVKHEFRDLSDAEVEVLGKLYETLLKLEKEGKNDVWVSIIRNAFAPMLKGKFDYVVGNPPWVNWESLPEAYREASKILWSQYGLAEIRGKTGLGKVKRDLAMLFLARCFDLYLKPGGRLGFLMPFTVFKTQAGAGFRRFLATKSRVVEIHDMVTLYPFEGAVNRTSAVVVEKFCELKDIGSEKCPQASVVLKENKKVEHVIWVNKLGGPIPTDTPLEEVVRVTDRLDAVMVPVVEGDASSPWMQVTERILPYVRKMTRGSSPYKAHEGVNVALNQVYYIQVKGKTPDGKLVVTNPPEPGQKKKVEQVEAVVEPDLVYPLIRGRDVKKWYVEYKNRYIIVPHDPKTGDPISHFDMKVRYPLTWKYFHNYFNDLISRGGEPYKSQLKPYRELGLEKGGQGAPPFYYLFNVKHAFAPYKVVWKEVSARMKAGGFHVAVVGLVEDEHLGSRVVVPNHTVVMIPAQDEEEAYYLAGVLNSTFTQFALQYAVVASVEEYISVPKFNSKSELHIKIAEISRKAHEIAKCLHSQVKPDYCKNIRDPEGELARVEDELDKAVAQLYGIPEEAIEDFRKLLRAFAGEEVSEEVSEEEEVSPSVDFVKTDVVAGQADFIEFSISTSGLCDKAEVVLEAPWGSQRLTLGDGRHRVEVEGLAEGVYRVRYSFSCGDYRKSGEVEVRASKSSPRSPRRPSTFFTQ